MLKTHTQQLGENQFESDASGGKERKGGGWSHFIHIHYTLKKEEEQDGNSFVFFLGNSQPHPHMHSEERELGASFIS